MRRLGAGWVFVVCSVLAGCGSNAPTGDDSGLDASELSDAEVHEDGAVDADDVDAYAPDTSVPLPPECTFETLDTFDYASATGTMNMATAGVALGEAMIVAGYGTDGDMMPNRHWLTRRRAQDGQWTTVDDFVLAENAGATPMEVTKTDDSTVFVAGSATDATNVPNAHWVVRRSKNGGDDWETVDDFELVPGANRSSTAYGVVGSGDFVIAVGYAGDDDTNQNQHWIVRRSKNGGDDWETVDDFELLENHYCQATNVTLHGQDIYVSGACRAAPDSDQWIIRRSTNGGDSWETVDDFVLADGRDAFPSGIASGGGRIYACGFAYAVTGNANHWVARGSMTGAAFTGVDDVAPTSSVAHEFCHGIAADSERVWTVGVALLSPDTWRVRSARHGEAFTVVNALAPGASAYARDIFFAQEDVVIVGRRKETGDSSWFVQRGHCD